MQPQPQQVSPAMPTQTTPFAQPMAQAQAPQPVQPMAQAPQPAQQQMMISNTETIPGKTIVQTLGLVTGSTVRAKHIGKDIMAGFKNMVGGELKGYTELLSEARDEALHRMILDAGARGANAVLNVRFSTSSVAGGAAELFAYGTAAIVQ